MKKRKKFCFNFKKSLNHNLNLRKTIFRILYAPKVNLIIYLFILIFTTSECIILRLSTLMVFLGDISILSGGLPTTKVTSWLFILLINKLIHKTLNRNYSIWHLDRYSQGKLLLKSEIKVSSLSIVKYCVSHLNFV